jgi:thioredoxin-related protein
MSSGQPFISIEIGYKEIISMSELINWRTEWQEALHEAKKTNRPLALEFYMEGWPHCSRLVRETHQDPAVVQAINERFIPVRLEGRTNMELVRQFQVTGAPTTLLFSSDGEEKHRFAGFQPALEYLRELTKGGWGDNFAPLFFLERS